VTFIEVSFEEALLIHTAQLDRYGGLRGLKSEHALRAALARPNTGYYDDILQVASALMESLINNHPFHDGNKRVAVQGTLYFLSKNGYPFQGSLNHQKAFNELTQLMNTGTCYRLNLENWLRNYLELS
jgi:death-on-curing protein